MKFARRTSCLSISEYDLWCTQNSRSSLVQGTRTEPLGQRRNQLHRFKATIKRTFTRFMVILTHSTGANTRSHRWLTDMQAFRSCSCYSSRIIGVWPKHIHFLSTSVQDVCEGCKITPHFIFAPNLPGRETRWNLLLIINAELPNFYSYLCAFWSTLLLWSRTVMVFASGTIVVSAFYIAHPVSLLCIMLVCYVIGRISCSDGLGAIILSIISH